MYITRLRIGTSFIAMLFFFCVGAQKTAESRGIESAAFDRTVSNLLDFTVPTITVVELHDAYENYLILDAREPQEYQVSHLANAQFIGYDQWDENVLKDIPKDQAIVIYCSIGYRSEKIGEKLLEKGYTNVQNLYGSIFEWVNQSYPIVDSEGNESFKIHGFSRLWGIWINNSDYKKVY